jgi:hypothetical protein
MEARDAGNAGDVIERQRRGEMALDVPERFLGRIHDGQPSCEATASWPVAARFI